MAHVPRLNPSLAQAAVLIVIPESLRSALNVLLGVEVAPHIAADHVT